MKTGLHWKWFAAWALLIIILSMSIYICVDFFSPAYLAKIYIQRIATVASLAVGFLALLAMLWLAQRFSKSIDVMCRMATKVSRNDFTMRAPTHMGGELNKLGRALNEMAAQLELRLRELTEERTELRAILANMAEGVLLVDPKGKIRLANQTLLSQFHLPENIFGKTVMEVFRSASLNDLVAHLLEKKQVSDQELSFLGPQERVFNINASFLQKGDGGYMGAIIVFYDITRLKQLENMRKEFVANVSHELRTPLSIIKGYLETLLDGELPDEQTMRQFLKKMQKHSERLEILIKDLLTISELESQKAELHFESVSLHSMGASVASELVESAKAKSISISLEISEDARVRADPQRLHQVFLNLIDNAIKYIQIGGLIKISAKAKNGEIEVCISDNGQGISPEHLPHVFERFYRVEKARSRELGGTGLGLSIVKHIVQAHGGRVWVESQIGQGSSFYFTFLRA